MKDTYLLLAIDKRYISFDGQGRPMEDMSLGLDMGTVRGTLLEIQSKDVSSSWYGDGDGM
jgi:hypothetical protein